jgi:hypothetical protein
MRLGDDEYLAGHQTKRVRMNTEEGFTKLRARLARSSVPTTGVREDICITTSAGSFVKKLFGGGKK